MNRSLGLLLVGAFMAALIWYAWWAMWRHGHAIADLRWRFGAFAVMEVALVAFVVTAMPEMFTPITVALAMIGGFYIGRGYEQARAEAEVEDHYICAHRDELQAGSDLRQRPRDPKEGR